MELESEDLSPVLFVIEWDNIYSHYALDGYPDETDPVIILNDGISLQILSVEGELKSEEQTLSIITLRSLA